jgi:tRNA A-37 threonylcarbamoyl transferase component Bud32
MADFLEFLRLKFKTLTGRNIIKIQEYVIKIYNDITECAYEHDVLSKIALSKPITFKVPKIFNFLKTQSYAALIMEYILGRHLDNYIVNFLLYGNSNAVKIFYQLGKAVRELHNMNLSGLRNSSLPSSCSELKHEIAELSKVLVAWKVIDHRLFNIILKCLEKANPTDEIFLSVSLHGELYFTHILVQDGKIVLIDFHNAQRGPSYFDLATLSISLYVSLTLAFSTLKRLTFLIEAFLVGYYGKTLNSTIIRSLKLAELYLALREILTCAKTLCFENSPAIKFIAILKIRRLRKVIKEVIIPKLTA